MTSAEKALADFEASLDKTFSLESVAEAYKGSLRIAFMAGYSRGLKDGFTSMIARLDIIIDEKGATCHDDELLH